jgi:hypothetical protein
MHKLPLEGDEESENSGVGYFLLDAAAQMQKGVEAKGSKAARDARHRPDASLGINGKNMQHDVAVCAVCTAS